MSLKKPIEFRTAFSTYIASEKIGEGGSGTVYSAEEEGGSSVAVKLLDRSKTTRERLKRFENEYRFCSQTDHPNIIHVTDYGLHDDRSPFFVMPLYEGSLRQLMASGLSPEAALQAFFKIMDGVEAAHLLSVVHRDIKPENILVRSQGEDLVVADFGIAEFTSEDLYTAVETKPNTRLANFLYAAPEQRIRGANTDCRTDIYSLGLILNEMITGTIPQGTKYKTIAHVAEDFSYLDPVVATMLSQEPDDRPNTIREIRQELNSRRDEFVSHQKISKLKNTVIPEGEIDDPLAHTPPEILDCDWRDGVLTLKLDQPVHHKWIHALADMGSYHSVYRCGPENFSFSGNEARVSVGSESVQDVVNHFKDWLPKASNKLKQILHAEHVIAERKEREEIARRLAAEEERQRVLNNVKF